jgi:hypothetical protein
MLVFQKYELNKYAKLRQRQQEDSVYRFIIRITIICDIHRILDPSRQSDKNGQVDRGRYHIYGRSGMCINFWSRGLEGNMPLRR